MTIGIDDHLNLKELLSQEALQALLCRFLTLESPSLYYIEDLMYEEFSSKVPTDKQIEVFENLNLVLEPHYPRVMSRILRNKVV